MNGEKPRFVVWFSCGAASAVAAKLSVDKYGADCSVVYCDTAKNEHPDNSRFLSDVARWIGRDISVIRSTRYPTIESVFMSTRYMSGVRGARCTTELKKVPRENYQRERDTHIFGYTVGEEKRAERFEANNPSLHVEWILIDHGVTKSGCLAMLEQASIPLPAMYALGFEHNNCLGCVKSASAGYWNRTRKLFPEVFAARAGLSRRLGVRLVKLHGKRVYLDELPNDATAPDDNIECGPVCQTPEDDTTEEP